MLIKSIVTFVLDFTKTLFLIFAKFGQYCIDRHVFIEILLCI